MKKKERLRLQWHITERCNWHCKHCYIDDSHIKNELSLTNMLNVFESFLRLGDRLSVQFPLMSVLFTGGEPFIRKDFIKFLEEVSQYKDKIVFTILTNGSFLTEDLIIKLKNEIGVRSIQLSLEGCRDTNDDIRGKGTYDLVKEKVKLLARLGMNTQISLTVTKNNLNDIPMIISDFSAYRVRFNLRRFVPLGRGSNMKAMMLSPTETEELYEYIEKVRHNSSLRININKECEEGIFGFPVPDMHRRYNCGLFDRRSISIAPNGDVYPCRRFPIKIGNAMEKDLADILLKSEIYNKLSDIKTNDVRCLKCKFFDKCKGGSRCIAYAYFDNGLFDNPDPQCPRLFKKLS